MSDGYLVAFGSRREKNETTSESLLPKIERMRPASRANVFAVADTRFRAEVLPVPNPVLVD